MRCSASGDERVSAAPADDGDPSTRLTTSDRPLLVPLVSAGEVVGRTTLDEARAHHLMARAELPRAAGKMSRGEPVIETLHV